MNFSEILDFVKQEIKNSGRIEYYPFRDRYQHTLRVLKWAERIQKEEGGDPEVIRITCAFHDTGWDKEIAHNILSREIAERYLTEHEYDSDKLVKVLEAVENHNQRDSKKVLGIESYIVMDADILDEVGALSIIWDAMAAQKEGNKDYCDVLKRIKYYFGRLKSNAILLKTETGKRMYAERLRFISQFIDELVYELF